MAHLENIGQFFFIYDVQPPIPLILTPRLLILISILKEKPAKINRSGKLEESLVMVLQKVPPQKFYTCLIQFDNL